MVFHDRFKEAYSHDPASAPGRMEAILSAIEGLYEFVEPQPATDEDVLLVHKPSHLERVKSLPMAYPVALLAVGGALKASELALSDEPSFALIRPPGHHASPDSSWGFCYFNNVAIAVEKALRAKRASKAIIVDFDLHFGDGTERAFRGRVDVIYYHLPTKDFVAELERLFEKLDFDLMAVSAGFDRSIDDWGGLMKPKDFIDVGKVLKEGAQRKCGGRRFAVLEGGYNHNVLGRDVNAFLKGFS